MEDNLNQALASLPIKPGDKVTGYSTTYKVKVVGIVENIKFKLDFMNWRTCTPEMPFTYHGRAFVRVYKNTYVNDDPETKVSIDYNSLTKVSE